MFYRQVYAKTAFFFPRIIKITLFQRHGKMRKKKTGLETQDQDQMSGCKGPRLKVWKYLTKARNLKVIGKD